MLFLKHGKNIQTSQSLPSYLIISSKLCIFVLRQVLHKISAKLRKIHKKNLLTLVPANSKALRLRRVYTMEEKWHGSDKKWNGSNHFCKETVNFYPFRSGTIRGVYTTEKKWHGPDKNWNGSNSFYKETVNFYPFRDGSIGAYGPVAERIKVHCFFVKLLEPFQFLSGPCHFFSVV